jgi:hypothetical protein
LIRTKEEECVLERNTVFIKDVYNPESVLFRKSKRPNIASMQNNGQKFGFAYFTPYSFVNGKTEHYA